MIEASRLLGFAFANADLLFEIDREGRVLFSTGAAREFGQTESLTGRAAAELFQPADGARFTIMVRGLASGDRMGPLPVTMAGGAKASLAMCYLPQNKNIISCTLARPGNRAGMGGATDMQTGLPDRNAFLAAASRAAGKGAMALVELPNLPDVCAGLSQDDAQLLLAHIGKSVATMGAKAAGRISPTGFGIISDDPKIAMNLASRIQTAAREKGVTQLAVEDMLLSLKDRGLTPEQTMLALRHVIGRFAEGKISQNRPTDLAGAFDMLMQETIARAVDFNATISDGKFKLNFEPIVDLKTGQVAHYEALTRFAPGESPAETIRFAEEIGIADTFDMSVAVKLFTLLEQDSSTASVAFNISGRSVGTPASFAMLAGLLARKRALAKRVLIEITESSEIADLTAADAAIAAVRQMGYRVGIDDFGAGAASLQYLHGITVDFVKMDGALIQRLGKSPREDALLRGVLNTCTELNIETIAEWIDSPDRLQRCKDMGFKLGQGRQFGAGLEELPRPAPTPAAPVRARRMGVQESWG